MTYAPISTGLINATDFPLLPAWLTNVGTGGSVTVSGNTCVIHNMDAGTYRYLTSTSALPASRPMVIRLKGKVRAAYGATYFQMLSVQESGTQPSDGSYDNGVRGRPHFSQATLNDTMQGRWDAEWPAIIWSSGGGGIVTQGTYYIWEISWDAPGTTVTMTVRDATTMIALGQNSRGSVSYTNPLWLMMGSGQTGETGEITLSNLSIMESLNISMTGVGADVVELYDAAGNLKVTGVTAGGVATLDCSLIDFGGAGFTGYFMKGATRLPTAGNTSVWGGDIFPPTDIPPTPPAPDPWNVSFDESRPFMTGRVVCENGEVINFADLLEGNRIVSATGRKPSIPETGRVVKEDNSIINIADLLEG